MKQTQQGTTELALECGDFEQITPELLQLRDAMPSANHPEEAILIATQFGFTARVDRQQNGEACVPIFSGETPAVRTARPEEALAVVYRYGDKTGWNNY